MMIIDSEWDTVFTMTSDWLVYVLSLIMNDSWQCKENSTWTRWSPGQAGHAGHAWPAMHGHAWQATAPPPFSDSAPMTMAIAPPPFNDSVVIDGGGAVAYDVSE